MDFGTFEEELAMKSYIVALLTKQAVADGAIAEAEKKYLHYAAATLQLQDDDLSEIIKAPESFYISPPPDEDKRITILYYLLFMMKADNHIDEKEEQLCYKIGFQMGFRQEMVTNLIGVMKQYLLDQIPPEAMIEKIKPYLN